MDIHTAKHKNMTPAKTAKKHGTTITKVSEFTTYNLDTLRRCHRDKPQRYEALCLATVCNEVGLTGSQLRAYKMLIG